jgi:DNA-binding NtrC family response regulator
LNDRSDAGRSTLALHERNIAAEHHNTLWDEKLPAHMRLALILSSAGTQTVVATTGSEAIRIFEEHHLKIDLLLVDVVMPEMSGPELFDCLRSVKPELKVLFMSGYDRVTVSGVRGFSWNYPFIQKPFDATALFKTIKSILRDRVRLSSSTSARV